MCELFRARTRSMPRSRQAQVMRCAFVREINMVNWFEVFKL